MSALVYDFVQDVLTLRFPEWATQADRAERLDFVRRFQQITGPVTAKGYEDTVLYRFNRLVSLNEVGGDPSRFGASIAEFHAANAERRLRSPHALSATATHDTKRGEDVRARINVLSEIPIEWRARVGAWQRLNRKLRETVDGRPTPGANTEYLIYQTLVGAWPIDAERLRAYVLKATREAKSHTSWINPNARYDEALARFVDAILDPVRSSRVPGRLHDVPGPRGPLRRAELAGPDPGEDHRARRARLLPGHRAVGSEPGGSRQPATGRLGPSATAAGRARRRPPPRANDRAALTQELVQDPGGRPREDVPDPRGAGVPRPPARALRDRRLPAARGARRVGRARLRLRARGRWRRGADRHPPPARPTRRPTRCRTGSATGPTPGSSCPPTCSGGTRTC